MTTIKRYEINEEWAHSGIIEAGDFVFSGYCVGDNKQGIDGQISGAMDHLESRLALVHLTLENVVQIDALFRNIQDIPAMEKVFKERFKGRYPVRKSIQTNFVEEAQLFQLDALAYKENKSHF